MDVLFQLGIWQGYILYSGNGGWGYVIWTGWWKWSCVWLLYGRLLVVNVSKKRGGCVRKHVEMYGWRVYGCWEMSWLCIVRPYQLPFSVFGLLGICGMDGSDAHRLCFAVFICRALPSDVYRLPQPHLLFAFSFSSLAALYSLF